MKNKISEIMLNADNKYILKIDDTIVKLEYANNNKTFKECMINIIEKKLKD